ncbi:Succinate dehydrogenase/fumarate reductase, flavoprotein subunit [Nocardia farcinica]|uniref:Fumarate reductase flavoprotein subunit n=1 Tax=Nocardia farcinica TaxID=37329 RepID=A0A0H5P1U4_NOCFR|nr:FAD-dependent oxidoreductase [Nocardia farcinica]AXK85191.1 FAD-dependent oxidoreductase [Nocardia farcinica]PFX05126.1 Fumarate reductase flavoprotein subunit [Nocardia farcinica]PFX10396.1 Fumarate reductase flavoprotein subunit [Nocardia farcinica]CRY76416.1 Fumarate reductase flavoprotein subunit precursor [Nocardia farcinica]SIS76481.1 Succinate dehydrogenase/fumarate reductase, flavoprotein subunit [Nocardia farcinica]
MSRIDTDVLVIGAGMAGLTTATRALDRGARVVVVEKAETVGGSALFAGYAWTAPDHAVMDRVNPGGDPELRRALVDGFADGVDWIRGLGVEVDEAVPVLGYGRGHRFDTHRYVEECRRRVRAAGTLLTGTETLALRTHDGAVTGAAVRLPDGATREIEAGATVLATGGFQADPELVRAHIHPAAAAMPLRSNPTSAGDGLRLAESVGAATGTPGSGFYGHLVPTGVDFRDSGDFVALSLYYSEHALLFDLTNRRFTDETRGDHLTAMALLDRPEARGLLIADERVHRDWVLGSYVRGAVAVDKFDLTRTRGGRCGLAEDLDELAYLPAEWGYDGAEIAAQIRAVNAAGAAVRPGRANDPAPLDRGPYYVIETRPALTFPFHGIRIDATGRVRAATGGLVPGLFAVGSDIGGLYDHAYAGGIAPALVFGLAAADAAVPAAVA